MMPLERSGAFTLACTAVLLIVAAVVANGLAAVVVSKVLYLAPPSEEINLK